MRDRESQLQLDRNRLSKSKLATDLIQQHKSVLQFVRVISLLWQGARQNIAGISNYFANRFEWRRLNCHEKITFVIEGRSFKGGIMQEEIAA